ncbi:MAG: AGE family epimerase/isomerase [Bacteroidota bacterium]
MTGRMQIGIGIFFSLLIGCSSPQSPGQAESRIADIRDSMRLFLEEKMVSKWYPAAIDSAHGGYHASFDYQWRADSVQTKFIVTQPRHLWTLSKIALRYPDEPQFRAYADHGFQFLRDVMYDHQYGGFFTHLTREGDIHGSDGAGKLIYGQAFVLFGLAAYADMSGAREALQMAQDQFRWIEAHAFDTVYGGYYQFLSKDGLPKPIERRTNASNLDWLSYKDQNTSIHLLEAYAELYKIWPDSLLKERLQRLVSLIRDTVTTKPGYMRLFFTRDWQPISFEDSVRKYHAVDSLTSYAIMDHLSYGHDIEAAYLMLDAEDALGIKDPKTLQVAQQLVDHSIAHGIDREFGGLIERGYYFGDTVVVISGTKTWWAQAEALNSLSLFSKLDVAGAERYADEFEGLWDYMKAQFLDWDQGGWYAQGLDQQPEFKTAPKGHNWKTPYHTTRALLLCLDRLE